MFICGDNDGDGGGDAEQDEPIHLKGFAPLLSR
jgi:hypothetical protein